MTRIDTGEISIDSVATTEVYLLILILYDKTSNLGIQSHFEKVGQKHMPIIFAQPSN